MAETVHTVEPLSPLQDGAGVSDWLRAISVRRLLVLVLFIVFFAGGLTLASLVSPIYEAEAVLEVLPQHQPNVPENPIGNAVSDTVSINTEAKKVGAEPVVRAVFQMFEAGTLGPVKEAPGAVGRILTAVESAISAWRERICSAHPASAQFMVFLCRNRSAADLEEARFAKFRSHLSVDTEHATRLIKVRYSAPSPELASQVANAVVMQYLGRYAEQMDSQNNRYVNWLESRLNVIGRQVEKSDEAVAKYRGTTGLIDMARDSGSSQRSPTVEELSHTLQDLATATSALATARVKLQTLQEIKSNPSKIKSSGEIVGSRLIQDLTLQEGEAEAKLAGMRSTYGIGSPLTAKGQAELHAIQNRIALEVGKLLDAAAHEYAGASEVVDRLGRQVAALKAKIAQEQLNQVGLRDLERRAGANADLYNTYLRQAREAIEAANWRPVAASIVANATPPVRPVFPNYRLLLPIGFVGSAAAAMLIAALVELHHQRRVFNGPLDFRGTTGLRVVGTVPRVRRPAGIRPPEKFRVAIESVACRLCALPGAGSERSLVVAVTSAVADEGKSVLAVSLARQYLGDGAKVAIIDADIRRPSVLRVLSAGGAGVVSAVRCAPDGTQWDGVDLDGLHVVTLADMDFSATVLLGALPRMISNLRQHYDVIVVDTPPLLVVSDALAAVPACDQIVFAVGWSSTSRDSVEYALQELSEAERSRTRIVLTKVGGRAYEQYGSVGTRRERGRIGSGAGARPSGFSRWAS